MISSVNLEKRYFSVVWGILLIGQLHIDSRKLVWKETLVTFLFYNGFFCLGRTCGHWNWLLCYEIFLLSLIRKRKVIVTYEMAICTGMFKYVIFVNSYRKYVITLLSWSERARKQLLLRGKGGNGGCLSNSCLTEQIKN